VAIEGRLRVEGGEIEEARGVALRCHREGESTGSVVGLSVQPGAWLGEDRQDDWVGGDEIEEARGVALGRHQGESLPGAWLVYQCSQGCG